VSYFLVQPPGGDAEIFYT